MGPKFWRASGLLEEQGHSSRHSEYEHRLLLLIPTGLDLHTGIEAGFNFSDFFPLHNPSRTSRNIMI